MIPFQDFFQYRDAVYSTPGLSTNAKAIAGALSKWADSGTGYFYPRHETMAEYIGVPVSTLRRGLKELQTAGLLKVVTTQKGVDRTWNRNEYWLIMPDLCSPVDTGEADLCSPVDTGAVENHRPVLNPEPTSAQSGTDLCSIQDRPVLTSERTELSSELTREQSKELKTPAAASRGRAVIQPPLLNSVKPPTLVDASVVKQQMQKLDLVLGRSAPYTGLFGRGESDVEAARILFLQGESIEVVAGIIKNSSRRKVS